MSDTDMDCSLGDAENDCGTCGGTRRRQVDRFGNVWGDRLAEAMSTIIVGDIECPDCVGADRAVRADL